MPADGANDLPHSGGPRNPDRTPARLVHRTRERARLRVPSRRRDLDWFLALYEDLRAHPDIDEVTMNPVTGSVVLSFAPGTNVDALLSGNRLLTLAAEPPPEGAHDDGHPHHFHSGLNNMRILIFLIMSALSIQQLLKGQFLVPILTIMLYVVDLAVNLRLEQEAALEPHPNPGKETAPQ